MKSLSGKTILITGAASGIGRHMALWFAKKRPGLHPLQIFFVVPGPADYSATKFAVAGYSDALRMKMKKTG